RQRRALERRQRAGDVPRASRLVARWLPAGRRPPAADGAGRKGGAEGSEEADVVIWSNITEGDAAMGEASNFKPQASVKLQTSNFNSPGSQAGLQDETKSGMPNG